MRGFSIASALVLALVASAGIAAPTQVPAPSAATAYSSTTTNMGTLLANPATKAVLIKQLPQLMEKMADNMERVSGMTLKEMQDALKTYAPDALPDAKLAEIDLELAKIAVVAN